MPNSTCPTCKGKKTLTGIACPGFKRVEIPCFDCGGEGTISDLKAFWKAEGQRLKQCRKARRLTIRKAAYWIGVSMDDWMQAELGRVDPFPVSKKLHTKIDEELQNLRTVAQIEAPNGPS